MAAPSWQSSAPRSLRLSDCPARRSPRLPGDAAYTKYCASCHDQVNPRTPSRDALTKMSAARILRTMDFGLMMSIASPMRRIEREAVANFLDTGADDARVRR